VKNRGISPEASVETGFEHRLAGEKSLAAMLKAVEWRECGD
jgi:hypothetical protein